MSDQEVEPEMITTNDPEVFRTALQIMRERGMYAVLRQVAQHDRWTEGEPAEPESEPGQSSSPLDGAT